jgi:hypothetical protein
MANHLSGESSPYLLQHAGNPVDWYPWGPEAMQKAGSEDKPIFLSIGYSSCHWCHVMERESFEDEATASFLNAHFVSIKVDREERPDLDAVYMEAVQALTGQGGWPLSAWLTSDGTPFFGGTYFPPAPRRGTPSFRQVLEAIADTWHTRRSDLARTADAVRDHLRRDLEQASGPEGSPTGLHTPRAGDVDLDRILDDADRELHTTMDPQEGGWGAAPKFPQPLVLEYLLARQTNQPKPPREHDVRLTLDAMAGGGMYDHVGGGFHRYSTDGHWLVPHFEKMLYDNVQLARCYLHAWQLLGAPRYRAVATETLDYLLREMQHPLGGFFSAQDADTTEGEGTFFTWTPADIRAALDEQEAAAMERTYGVTEEGDFEGRSILHLPRAASAADRCPDTADPLLVRARAKLLAVRNTRPRPARDEKIIASWNGLAIAAFADAAVALGSPTYREAAERTAGFFLEELTPGFVARATGVGDAAGPSGAGSLSDGAALLLHSWTDGRTTGEGFLDDYACVAEGLLALYRCTFDERWFAAARALVEGLLGRFRRTGGGFYDTSLEHEALITRPRGTYDSPTPSGNSMAATVLLKMAAYTGEDRYRAAAEEALASLATAAERAPVMAGQWLSAALLATEGPTEVAVVGDPARPDTQALLKAVRSRFRPLATPAFKPPGACSQVAILLDREPPVGTSAAAWVCRGSTCAPPTPDPATLEELLDTAGLR